MKWSQRLMASGHRTAHSNTSSLTSVKARVHSKSCGCLSTWSLLSEPRKSPGSGNCDLCELAWIGAHCSVCSAHPTGPQGSCHLPRSQNRLDLDFLWSCFTLSFKLSLSIFSPNIFFQTVQWSEPFLLLLNRCQMCTAAWKIERLGESVMNISLFPFYFPFSEPFSLEKEEDEECSLHSTVYNSLTKSPLPQKKIKNRKRAPSIT